MYFVGVYWFCYEPRNVKLQLKKPVKLEIQHCAKPDCTSDLSFVRASSNQEKLPYTFEHLKGGNFTSCSSYGLCYKLSNLLLGSFLDHHAVETQAQSKVDLHDIVVNVRIKLNCRIIVLNLLWYEFTLLD